VEQELLILPQHLKSSLVFSVVRAAQSSVFCVVFCRLLFVLFSSPCQSQCELLPSLGVR
jgi:hypothetical protein